MQRQVRSIQKTTTLAHKAYCARSKAVIPTDHITSHLQPGRLAMLLRPSHNKLLTANSGPNLATKIHLPHIHLSSLLTGTTNIENAKNVRPIHLHFHNQGV